MALFLSSNLLHLHESCTTPLPSIELLGQMAPRRKSRAFNLAISSELGEGIDNKTNMRTSRPLRKARKADSPFVDSAIAISDDEDNFGTSDEDALPKRLQSRKRKRSVSPDLSTPAQEAHPTSSADSEHEIEVDPKPTTPPTSTPGAVMHFTLSNMTITVPEGHQGPILLQIDPKSLPGSIAAQPLAPRPSTKRPRTTAPAPTSAPTSPPAKKRSGFLDLPPELRNEIYRQVFVADTRLDFAKPTNFSRGAAFLRTCRQVHAEGRSILYAENDFFFSRRTSRFGSFWHDDWRELGFRAIHAFVKAIGAPNLALIRTCSLQLEDATPCLNPDSMTHDDRRFVNDDLLMSILRALGDHARLRTLRVNFHGRRRVEATDARFLEYLSRVKADELEFVKYPIGRGDSYFSSESKQEEGVRKMLVKSMVRKQKLYD